MDLRSGSTIIGKLKMQQRILRKEDTQPSRKDGTMIFHLEKLHRNMDGLLSTASSWTTFKQSKSNERNRCKNQYVLRWNTEKNPGKRLIQEEFERQPHLLRWLNKTRKEREMLIFHKVADSGRGRPTSSYVRNSDANVKIGDKFMGRRLHPLNPRRPGGNPNNGKNDINGKNDKVGTDGRNWTNEFRFPWPPSHFANFFASQSIVLS